MDKESLGNENIHIKSIGFCNQNSQWEFSPFGSQTKIPGKWFKFPSQSLNVAIGY